MKKKILFIINSLEGGGAEKVLIDILKNFDYARFDVELLLLRKIGIYLKDVPQIKIRYIFPNYLSFVEKICYNLYSRLGTDIGYKLLTRSRVGNYDVIISFLEGNALKYHIYITHKGKRNISWVHIDLLNNHYTIDSVFTQTQEQQSYAMMDSIVFVSNDAKKQFEKLYPNNKTKKEVILNPIDYDYISSYKREYNIDCEDRCFNIVSVGRLEGQKSYDRMIRLAKRLKEDNYNFHITIIGEGNERGKLEGLIEDYGLQNYMSLPGFFKPPYSKMAEADLFVSTSLAEGYPLVVCEALCLGLPVVSTKTTGPIELIDNDKYGILVDHDDDSIYQGVKRMIDDEQLRLHYHQMSLERAKIFNIEETMKQIYDVL
jgi:glycosyltransferase involved in cell wall biosynthesis